MDAKNFEIMLSVITGDLREAFLKEITDACISTNIDNIYIPYYNNRLAIRDVTSYTKDHKFRLTYDHPVNIVFRKYINENTWQYVFSTNKNNKHVRLLLVDNSIKYFYGYI